jgi:glycosyltransferase involved in cell wall biosynthesis
VTRVLHYVHDSLPQLSGYTIRTAAVAEAQADMGLQVAVADRVDHEVSWLARHGLEVAPRTERNGVVYLAPPRRMFRPGGLRHPLRRVGLDPLCRAAALPRYARWIAEQVGRPDVVHPHAPSDRAHDGARLARRFGVRLVYEVRYLWEQLSAAAPLEQALPRGLRACARADAVVAICRGLADALVAGGVPRGKVTVVPNGVDTRAFRPRPRDAELARRLDLEGRLVFGYATNVRRFEGVQTVVEAWPRVARELPDAVFLLIGEGQWLGRLRAMKPPESFRFLGRVPHEEMPRYHSLLDVFVVPRLPLPVCETITPVKPLEAMAMGVPVLASDVGGLRELVRDGETGRLFRAGDAAAAARACIELGRDAGLRRGLADRAREWVGAERDWRTVAEGYRAVYGLD